MSFKLKTAFLTRVVLLIEVSSFLLVYRYFTLYRRDQVKVAKNPQIPNNLTGLTIVQFLW